jgi:hypothetical protein
MVCGILFNVAIQSHSQKVLSSIANYGLVYKIPSHDKSRTTLFNLSFNKEQTNNFIPSVIWHSRQVLLWSSGR